MTSTPSLSNFSVAPTLAPSANEPSPSPSPSPAPQPPSKTDFVFPPQYSFPPFFTLQPVLSTRHSQLTSWSILIQSYCRFHRLFALTLIDALSTPLFSNAALSRRLSLRDARAVVTWMCSAEGQQRAEWVPTSSSSSTKKARDDETEGGGRFWVYWRRPEEWAAALEEWVDRTGQKGTVLTLYEITDSDATKREEFYGMDADLLARSLAICVRRGKAQVFGQEGSEGVKFF
ncbi:ESCRT-II complex, vps25 subunit [Polyplosphaeria fusca]|uniref:Vacuolar protein-sorting-associated protein 25 n=1 Tax=Polyplosphaeria fusca TaxID=682080 RepID=A0A9P4V2D7_9PLEO|nr:ESCRT-II complex, vps25 subunit [Polyplosphaeria fusca]